MERNKNRAIPWLIAAIWVVVIVLAVKIQRDAGRSAKVEAAVRREFAADVGRDGIAVMRVVDLQLIVDVTLPLERWQYESMAYGLARRFSELTLRLLGDGETCVQILHNGEPVLHLKTKKDGSLGEPTDGAP